MSEVLALQKLNPIGSEIQVLADDYNSSCSYVLCGGCSSGSAYSCKPDQ